MLQEVDHSDKKHSNIELCLDGLGGVVDCASWLLWSPRDLIVSCLPSNKLPLSCGSHQVRMNSYDSVVHCDMWFFSVSMKLVIAPE